MNQWKLSKSKSALDNHVSSMLFISDLHLDAARPAVIRAFAEFLSLRSHCDALYILGDLFEAWIGDDDDSALAQQVKDLLQKYTAAGPELFIMQGNRDFLLGHDFCHAVGATLLPDPSVIDLFGEPTLLMHGDSLCTQDQEYQELRLNIRNPQWQAQLLSQNLDQRRTLARQLRGMSTEANSNKAQDIMDVTPSEVDKVMQTSGVRQLIHGHTHRPAQHTSAAGTRWVLGDWDATGWVIESSPDRINLNKFIIKQ